MRRRVLGTVLLVLMAVTGALVLAPRAYAACHAFEVSVAPANPGEGSTVEVTVSRDAAVNPSSVRLRSVDGTATAGQDYQPVDQRVEFTSEVERTLTVTTLQDDVDEPDETFELVLSEGQGCPVNTRFTYGTATVTIVDDDEPAATTVPPTAAPTTAPQTTAAPTTTAAETTTTVGDTATSSTEAGDDTSTTTPGAAADATTTSALSGDEVATRSEGDDSGSGVFVAIAVVLAVAGAAAAYGVHRMRGRPSD